MKPIVDYPAPIRLGIFILMLGVMWLPIALPLRLGLIKDENLATIVTMAILFIEFLILVHFWGQRVYQKNLFREYGLEISDLNAIDCLNGLTIGLICTFALFGVMGVLGWVQWQRSVSLVRVIVEGSLTALGVGLAEELLFRGWLLFELERDYAPPISLWSSALIFALLHYTKPLGEMIRTFPQFPGLVLLGLILVWGKRSHHNRLGIAIGLHGGLIWGYYIVKVGNLVVNRDLVSPWLTGVDGNPLAGLMGLLFLGGLAFLIRRGLISKHDVKP